MKRFVVFGGSGQLAQALNAYALGQGIEVTLLPRTEIDLSDPGLDVTGAAERVLEQLRPDLVVNAAAYTAVDRAEDEPEAAFRLNAHAPGELARAAAAMETPFVHISTDYVFDGRGGPYRESDPVAPIGVYGRSKAEGEDRVIAAGGRAVILRTSWVYSATGSNFVRTMLRLAGGREEVGVVDDQRGRPTWANDLAEACWRAGQALATGELTETPILHVSNTGEASWADFAEAVFAGSKARGGPSAAVRRITTAEFPTRAQRPADSRLDLNLIAARLGWTPRAWPDALDLCLDQLLGQPGPVLPGLCKVS